MKNSKEMKSILIRIGRESEKGFFGVSISSFILLDNRIFLQNPPQEEERNCDTISKEKKRKIQLIINTLGSDENCRENKISRSFCVVANFVQKESQQNFFNNAPSHLINDAKL